MEKLNHVAIIMDGNGRWAQGKMRPRVWGHIRGARVVSEIVEEADDLGIQSLTLYAFSSENWSRPPEEVKVLLKILDKFLQRESERILKNRIKFKVIGELQGVPAPTLERIKSLQEQTANAPGLRLTFAFGYGSRNELIAAFNRFVEKNPGKKISEEMLEEELYNPETGDVDLLIRTGGDQRISNFLLWQCAYAELFFTPLAWPQMSKKHFRSIIEQVLPRERRFGGLGATAELAHTKILSKLNQQAFSKELH